MSIPSVDLGEFLSGDTASKKRFVQRIGKAYEEIGFVAVKNHGIDDGKINAKTSSGENLNERLREIGLKK
jgi:isopenicillin N synthase-like dioxygenase